MSRLRKQLLKLLPELSEQAKRLRDQDARQRWKLLRYVIKSKFTVKRACFKIGVSEDFFRKWGKCLLKAKSVERLAGRSRKPRRSPKKLHSVWEERIIARRDSHQYEGCETISHKIFEIFNRHIAPSTVNKVLKRNGLITKKASKKLHKEHLKRYRRPLPGYLQMDFKYVPYYVNDQQYYQLSCVDHHSSWRMIRIYPHKDLEAVESFLLDLAIECPFPIEEIQTDNDLAFTHKFWKLRMGFDPTFAHPVEEWCKENGVRHKLIPVGEKELNGKVENTHRQDDREFYSQINPQNLTHLQALSLVYEQRWNTQRKTKTLGWLTPDQVLWQAFVRVIAWLNILSVNWTNANVLKIPKDKNKLTTRAPSKRTTWLDRYLTWAEKDAKKYGT